MQQEPRALWPRAWILRSNTRHFVFLIISLAMSHPLAPDIQDLSDDELEKQTAQLTSRFWSARRLGINETVLHQLDLLLQHYELERERRQNGQQETSGIVLETDPLPQENKDDNNSTPKKFSPISSLRKST